MIHIKNNQGTSYSVEIDGPQTEGLTLKTERYNLLENCYDSSEQVIDLKSAWNKTTGCYVKIIPPNPGQYRFTLYKNGDITETRSVYIGEPVRVECTSAPKKVVTVAGTVQKRVMYIKSNVPISGKNIYYTVNGTPIRYYIPGVIKNSGVMFYIETPPTSFKIHVADGLQSAIKIIQ